MKRILTVCFAFAICSSLLFVTACNNEDSITGIGDPALNATHEHKVLVCHIPDDNPDNAHVISIAMAALPAHLAHGDCLAPDGAMKGDDCDCANPSPECEGATCTTFIPCNEPNDCVDPVCVTTAEGGGACLEGATPCAGLPDCNATSDCPEGWICAVETCCGRPVCVPPDAYCETAQGSASSTGRLKGVSSGGLTIGSR